MSEYPDITPGSILAEKVRKEHQDSKRPSSLAPATGSAIHGASAGSALPCPFCGGEAKIFKRQAHDTTPEPRHTLYWYVCSTYGCGVGLNHGEWSEQRALEKWNKRANAPNSAISEPRKVVDENDQP